MEFKQVLALAIVFFTVSQCSLASRVGVHDREHIQSHVQGELDLSRMSEDELRFLYFQSHDAEGNNKLDGCELIQSLLHFHAEESVVHGEEARVFTDDELSIMIDPILRSVDRNMDGFIDYPEFVSGPGIIGY